MRHSNLGTLSTASLDDFSGAPRREPRLWGHRSNKTCRTRITGSVPVCRATSRSDLAAETEAHGHPTVTVFVGLRGVGREAATRGLVGGRVGTRGALGGRRFNGPVGAPSRALTLSPMIAKCLAVTG